MKALLTIKWALVVMLTAVLIAPATPFLLIAAVTMPAKTFMFLEELGKQFARNCVIDFRRVG